MKNRYQVINENEIPANANKILTSTNTKHINQKKQWEQWHAI